MADLAGYQRRFAQGLLNEEPFGTGATRLDDFEGNEYIIRAGMSIYRNTVAYTLAEALRQTFPAVESLVGETFFKGLAGEFLRAYPPQSPVLARYGDAFPDYLDRSPHVADTPYLSDVARVEMAWLDAYHEADAPTIGPEALQGIAPEDMAHLQFAAHPAMRVLSSDYPVLTIWRGCQPGSQMPVIRLEQGGDDILITRPDSAVGVHALPRGGASFVAAISKGQSLGTAYEAVAEATPDFDLQTALSVCLTHGAFTNFNQLGRGT